MVSALKPGTVSESFFFPDTPPPTCGVWSSPEEIRSELQLLPTPQLQQQRVLNPLCLPGVELECQLYRDTNLVVPQWEVLSF